MKKFLIFLSLTGTFGLAACSSTPQGDAEQQAADQKLLAAYSWHLEKMTNPAQAGLQQAQINPFELNFIDDRLTVSGLCNRMSAVYHLDGQQIEVQPMMSTKMMCSDEALMQLEHFVGQTLPDAQQWQVRGADAAAPETAQPVLTLDFAAGGQWQFKGIPTPETQYGQQGRTVFLEVSSQMQDCAAGPAACFKVRVIDYDEQGLQTGAGDWFLLAPEQLQGFAVEPGYQSIIRTKRFDEKTTQGEERPVYIHDMTVESKQI